MAMNARLLRPLASGFNPKSISGLQAWWDAAAQNTLYDASTGGSVQSADSGLVARWEDRSGNNNHCTQSGADTIKPILRTAQVNGRKVVRFDGTDDRMIFSNIDAQAYTVLIIGRKWGTTTDAFIATGNSANFVPYSLADLTGLGTYGSKSTGGVNGDFAGATSRQLLRTSAFQATQDSSIAIWVDGSSVVLDDTGTVGSSVTYFNVLGARTGATAVFGKQDIGEVLIYNRIVSAAERQAAEQYLQKKWATP